MAGLVDEYLSNLVETMRNTPLVSALEPRQRFAMVLNAFFLAGARKLELLSCTHAVLRTDDLFPRVMKELKKQFK
jgi:hypothetical protein